MKKRTAVRPHNPNLSFECIGIYVAAGAMGWEWYVMEDQGDGVMYGFVQSPLCPEGEFGCFSVNEIGQFGAKFTDDLRDVLPPQGYVWKD